MSATLSRHRPRRRDGRRPRAQLFLALECERPLACPLREPLSDVDVVSFGRGERRQTQRSQREVALVVPDARMSSRHARLVLAGGAWILEDLGSKNGSFVAGQPCKRAELKDGDVFELGHTFFVYREALIPGELDGAVEGPTIDAPHPALRTVSSGLAGDYQRLARVAAAGVSVLITGESGTGKELVARAVHDLSGRHGRFVAVNCGALVDSLVQSELFGYKKGAFSGADDDRPGLIRTAHGGTLFLDEIGDLPAASQAVLLRVLQEREVQPLGATAPIAVDVRIVAATHQDLESMMEAGRFRRDLYARLAGFELELPPLADRVEDIGPLIGALLERHAVGAAPSLTPEAARALFAYGWPLNVRELEQCLSGAVALAVDGLIDAEHLPPAVQHAVDALERRIEIDEMGADDKRLKNDLIAALARHEGNVSAVARELDKDRKQIRRWVRRFGIDLQSFRHDA